MRRRTRRFGSFEVFAHRGQTDEVKTLADYVIDHHYPDLRRAENRYALFLREVVARHESGQASEEDERRMDEELFPLFWYPPKPELLASFFSRTIASRAARNASSRCAGEWFAE